MNPLLTWKDEFSDRAPYEHQKLHRMVDRRPAGIILNAGEGWSVQRRFALRTLRDFGFGRKSLEGSMNVEIDEMIEMYVGKAADKDNGGGNILISTDFNFPIINILWQIVAGRRITPDDAEACHMVDLVNELFIEGMGLLVAVPFFIVRLFPKLFRYRTG